MGGQPGFGGGRPGHSVDRMKRIGIVFLWILGAYLIGRAAVEPFVIDMSDPATYHLDWGGPHLIGVLAVHMGPGIIAAALMARAVVLRISGRRPRGATPSAVGTPSRTRG
jgi:hypothetical protein